MGRIAAEREAKGIKMGILETLSGLLGGSSGNIDRQANMGLLPTPSKGMLGMDAMVGRPPNNKQAERDLFMNAATMGFMSPAAKQQAVSTLSNAFRRGEIGEEAFMREVDRLNARSLLPKDVVDRLMSLLPLD